MLRRHLFAPIVLCALLGAAPPGVVPPDLPLPAAPPNGAEWLRHANVIQPDNLSQYIALVNPGDRRPGSSASSASTRSSRCRRTPTTSGTRTRRFTSPTSSFAP